MGGGAIDPLGDYIPEPYWNLAHDLQIRIRFVPYNSEKRNFSKNDQITSRISLYFANFATIQRVKEFEYGFI